MHRLELDTGTFFLDYGGDVTEHRYGRLAAAEGLDFDRAASHVRRTAYQDSLHEGLGLAPGIAEWLREAQDLGIRLAVASGSPRDWVCGLLAGVSSLEPFEVIVCGDEVPMRKPDPAVYLLALRRLDIPGARGRRRGFPARRGSSAGGLHSMRGNPECSR